MSHRILEWFEEIFLELEMCQLILFQETHSELSQSIQCEEANIRIVVTTNLDYEHRMIGDLPLSVCPLRTYLIEVNTDNLPDIRPLETNTAHVVICDVYQFLQGKEPWLRTCRR